MKYKKFHLALLALVCFSSVGYCDQLNLKTRLNLQCPESVSEKANRTSAFGPSAGSEILQDPIINSELNGLGSMMQIMSGNNSLYSMQEIQKQQGEYAKQQLQDSAPNK